MACAIYEELDKELMSAIHRQNLALDPGSGRKISIMASIQLRANTKRDVERAEGERNAHVVSCDQCKNDAQIEFLISQVKE